jgi:hypothetical protein
MRDGIKIIGYNHTIIWVAFTKLYDGIQYTCSNFYGIIAPETTSLVKTLVDQLQSWSSLYGQSDDAASFSLTPYFYPAYYNFACARYTST